MSPMIVQPDDSVIKDAAAKLRAGGVVAMPTETVYGLGADTLNAAALRRVYEMKGRPANNPLIAHVHDVAAAQRVVRQWDERCGALAEAFWPGPLTLVLPKADDVPPEATGGLDTIAVRCPDHHIALRLLAAFGSAVSAPSANRSGHVSPTTAQHVADDFAGCEALLILDGGPCVLGIESTVLDVTSRVPRILRPGSVTVEQLRAILGDVDMPIIDSQGASPGTAAAHYAPNTPTILVPTCDLQRVLAKSTVATVVLCFSEISDVPPQYVIEMSGNAAGYASRLYGALREADECGADRIIIEKPPMDDPDWRAILDRLHRAAT